MQSVQAHLQYLLRDLSKQQRTRGTCPIEEVFLGKQETKGWMHHLESVSRDRSQTTAEASKTGRGFRALSSVSSPTRDTRVSCTRSNATAKAVLLFHSLELSQLFHKPVLFRGVFVSSLQHASFFIQPPSARSISCMNHSREG